MLSLDDVQPGALMPEKFQKDNYLLQEEVEESDG